MIRFATGEASVLSRASSMAYSVKEPALSSQIATKHGLEYLALLQVPFI